MGIRSWLFIIHSHTCTYTHTHTHTQQHGAQFTGVSVLGGALLTYAYLTIATRKEEKLLKQRYDVSIYIYVCVCVCVHRRKEWGGRGKPLILLVCPRQSHAHHSHTCVHHTPTPTHKIHRNISVKGKLAKDEKEALQGTIMSSTTLEALAYAVFVSNAFFLVSTGTQEDRSSICICTCT